MTVADELNVNSMAVIVRNCLKGSLTMTNIRIALAIILKADNMPIKFTKIFLSTTYLLDGRTINPNS